MAARWAATTAEMTVVRWAAMLAGQLAEQKVASRAAVRAARMAAWSVGLWVVTKVDT